MPQIRLYPRTPKGHTLWQSLGPGLVTGAADDDPSGVATYSQAGAQIGMPILWTMPFTWPLMTAIQFVSGQIGRVTGQGLSANIRKYCGAKLAHPIMLLLFLANVFNLGADISAMGSATTLIVGGDPQIFAVLLAVISVVLQVLVPYHRYSHVLKWLTCVLFAYLGVMLFVHVSWSDVLLGTFLPTISWNESYMTTFVALLGTTITPYCFFWQSSQEVEEIRTHRKTEHALRRHPEEAPRALRMLRTDTLTGMGISNIVAYFIILATAATLHAHHVTDISTAEQAAQALQPLAGPFCSALFAIGILGTGLLAVPVLAGSAAFAVAEGLRFKSSLEAKPSHAKRFYFVLTLATLLGVLIIYSGLNPIHALLWSAVINGVISAPIMVIIMMMGTRKKVMGAFTIKPIWRVLGWLATALMGIAVIIFFMTLFH